MQEFYAHEAFVYRYCTIPLHHHDVTIYSISPFKELLDDFVSCGEDGTLRVWRGMHHPLYTRLHPPVIVLLPLSIIILHYIININCSLGLIHSFLHTLGGSCAQTVELPCVSVWSVHVMECGDIVVGGSDSVARVFTLDTTKLASSEHLSVSMITISSSFTITVRTMYLKLLIISEF